MSNKLTLKQRVFCEHYAASGNGAAAARAAGYKNPAIIASENLIKLNVKKYLKQLSKNAESKRIATFKERQQMLTQIIRDEVDQQTRDRLKAVELLGKMQGDFIERIHHEGEIESPIRFYLPSNGRD